MELSRTASASTRGSGTGPGQPKKTITSTYRRVGRSSTVDESLFTGGGAKKSTTKPRNLDLEKLELQTMDNRLAGPHGKVGKAEKNPPKRDTLRLITKDLVRTLRIPQEDPSGKTVVLPTSEFERIKRNAIVLTKEEQQAEVDRRKQHELQKQEASTSRRKEMLAFEEERKRVAKPSDLEQEALERAQHLQSQAESATIEQEDEIKKLNEVLLEAKVNAIRDLQLSEKKKLDASYAEEEKRLDGMMEAERKRIVEEHERKERERRLERLEGADVLRSQIDKQEQERLLSVEKKDQETQNMLQYLQRLQEEDMENMRVKKEKQVKLMVEVGKANEAILQQKEVRREQEKQEELQVAKYLREKAEREEQVIKEAELQRVAKEKEIARLRSLQERAKDEQAEKDALRAKRDQEAAERDWRRKERERIAKEAVENGRLRRARVEQVQHREHYLSVQATRDRDMFDTMVHEQVKALEEDKQTEQRHAAARRDNATVVRSQIKQKEAEKLDKRSDFFLEGQKLDKEAQERRERLHSLKMAKLDQLREIGIPDKYCSQVSRHIHAPPATFTMGKPT